MNDLAALYTDEDMSALVAVLLRSRGIDVTTVPEQSMLGKKDSKQLAYAASMGRCILTYNRVDFEQLHIQYMQDDRKHSGIIVIPQKNAYETAQRIGILVSSSTASAIVGQLLYA